MAARSGTESDTNLAALDTALRRLTRRAGRQRRGIAQDTAAWQRWSASIDEGLALVARIECAPVRDLAELAITFRAILWRIQADEGVIMDEGLQHSLRRFGRQMARMARE